MVVANQEGTLKMLRQTVRTLEVTLITLLRVPILRPNWQYKASTAEMA